MHMCCSVPLVLIIFLWYFHVLQPHESHVLTNPNSQPMMLSFIDNVGDAGCCVYTSAQGIEMTYSPIVEVYKKNTDHADIHTTPANLLVILLNSMPLAMVLSNNNLYIPVII